MANIDDVLSMGEQLVSSTSCADAKAGFYFFILRFITGRTLR